MLKVQSSTRQGQTNIYSVQVMVRGENGCESLKGNICVTAENGSSNVFRVSLRGNLSPTREPAYLPYYAPGISPRWPGNVLLDDNCRV